MRSPVAYSRCCDDRGGFVVVGNGDDGLLRNFAHVNYEATARDIVHAVNSHAAMVAALREVAKIGASGVVLRHETGKPVWDALADVRKIAEAAIAKAEGGEERTLPTPRPSPACCSSASSRAACPMPTARAKSPATMRGWRSSPAEAQKA